MKMSYNQKYYKLSLSPLLHKTKPLNNLRIFALNLITNYWNLYRIISILAAEAELATWK